VSIARTNVLVNFRNVIASDDSKVGSELICKYGDTAKYMRADAGHRVYAIGDGVDSYVSAASGRAFRCGAVELLGEGAMGYRRETKVSMIDCEWKRKETKRGGMKEGV
jgi:hypothetical protein